MPTVALEALKRQRTIWLKDQLLAGSTWVGSIATDPGPDDHVFPEEVLLEEATDRLAELHLSEEELDEVVDYAAFVKDRGRRALARRRESSSTPEVEEPEATLTLPGPDDEPPELDDEECGRTPAKGEGEDARILEYHP